ncbi:Pentatricopeptide repeat-containing protein [Quillaja saponaria]|uniref:Pentatricopeptide repeat-containing protein n=1 Tax=Quillaja saponaria TaxID=32244 RepID=A0AAD7VDL0_QUISA|nr:Pentatricopeptide repeat-containing protein [Quillaja saponaria]
MTTITKFSAVLCMVILFSKLQALSSTNDPKISASPTVLPYITAPNMSSFFPSPTTQRPMSSAAPPNPEELQPIPSSGEFVGKKSSSSSRLDNVAATIGAMVCSLVVIELVVVA